MPKHNSAILNSNVADDQPIIELLQTHIEMLRGCIVEEYLGPIFTGFRGNERTIELADDLKVLMRSHPLFEENRTRNIANGSIMTGPDTQAVERILEFAGRNSPQQALEWYRRVLACEESEIRVISAVCGVEVHDEIEFLGGHRLSPPGALAWSAKATAMTPDPLDINRFIRPLDAGRLDSFIWTSANARLTAQDAPRLYEGQKVHAEHQDVLVGLTIDPEAAATSSLWWWEDANPDLQFISRSGTGHMGAKSDGPDQHFAVKLSRSTPPLVNQYLALSGDWRNSCRIALSTLGLARRMLRPAPKALQLCIGLEALLGQDTGSGEVVHKVTTRAAILLAEGYEAREQKRKAFKKLYDMRSRVVHGSVADDQKVWDSLTPTVPDIERLCLMAVERPEGFPVKHLDLMGRLP